MSWQDDLLKKEAELHKEEIHGQKDVGTPTNGSRSGSRAGNGSVCSQDISSTSSIPGSGSGGIFRGTVSKKINKKEPQNSFKEGETKAMITAKGVFEDYNKIDKEPITVVEKIWKFLPKIVKLLLNVRTNDVVMMKKLGCEMKTKETDQTIEEPQA